MEFDFDAADRLNDYVTVPPGTYVCRIAEVREHSTRDGSPRWGMRLEVVDGEYAGRTAAWDSLVFSERGLPRVKQVLQRFGFDVSGAVDLVPQDLIDLRARAQCLLEEYEDKLTGRRQTRLRVPYLGYESLNGNGNGNGHG